jgi:hypothetical protein
LDKKIKIGKLRWICIRKLDDGLLDQKLDYYGCHIVIWFFVAVHSDIVDWDRGEEPVNSG